MISENPIYAKSPSSAHNFKLFFHFVCEMPKSVKLWFVKNDDALHKSRHKSGSLVVYRGNSGYLREVNSFATRAPKPKMRKTAATAALIL